MRLFFQEICISNPEQISTLMGLLHFKERHNQEQQGAIFYVLGQVRSIEYAGAHQPSFFPAKAHINCSPLRLAM